MPESLDIGPSPTEEDCAALGVTENFASLNRIECTAYIAALTKVYGEPPAGARFRTYGNRHDYGTYYEVQIVYDPHDEDQSAYAFKVESGLSTWSEANFWPPVTYDGKSQAVSVILDVTQLDRERNPTGQTSRQDARQAA